MKKTRNLVLLIALALVLVAGAVGGGYAYWAGTLAGPDQVEEEAKIEIGTGQDITTVINLTNKVVGEGKLVPKGKVKGTTDVDEIVITFNVLWTDDDDASHGADGTLTITPEFNENPANLLKVVVNGDGAITAGETKEIKLTITLTEPANKAQYDSVANQNFTLSIKFSVELADTP